MITSGFGVDVLIGETGHPKEFRNMDEVFLTEYLDYNTSTTCAKSSAEICNIGASSSIATSAEPFQYRQ